MSQNKTYYSGRKLPGAQSEEPNWFTDILDAGEALIKSDDVLADLGRIVMSGPFGFLEALGALVGVVICVIGCLVFGALGLAAVAAGLALGLAAMAAGLALAVGAFLGVLWLIVQAIKLCWQS